MKNIFVWIKEFVLKYKKKLIFWVLVFFIANLCLFWLGWIGIENNVYAADNNVTTQTQSQSFESVVTEKNQLMSIILKFSYILLYPILFLAAKLVDNSFVYWEFFGFDAVLWQLWNVMKNLSNFALWFIFIYYTFKYLISWSGSKAKDRKWIITRSLIAWIWIQASWFLMAVLIDISTILIYGVWWLPVSILGDVIDPDAKRDIHEELGYNPEDYDPYVLKLLISVDVNDLDNLNVYYTNIDIGSGSWNFYISECETFSYRNVEKDKPQNIILSPKMIYYQDWNWKFHNTDRFRCSYLGTVYYFNSDWGYQFGDSRLDWNSNCKDYTWCVNNQIEYNNIKTKVIQDLRNKPISEIKTYVENAKILEIWNAHMSGWILWWIDVWAKTYWPDEHYWIDIGNKWVWTWVTATLSQLLKSQEKTNSYVWIFTSLYSSLLSQWRFIENNNSSTYVNFLNNMLLVAYNIALFIPLVVMAVVFTMRIWIIWMAIVLAPVIVLLTVFELFDKVKWGNSKFFEYFEIKNLIPIIFSPAIICFAISMSLVLVSIITKINTKHIETNEDWILWWLIKMDVAWFSVWVWQLIVSIIWVAITWFLVWAAIQSSKLWESGIIKSMKNLAETSLWSISIVPIPTKEWVQTISLNKAFWLNGTDSLLNELKSDTLDVFRKEDSKVVDYLINGWNPEKQAQSLYEQYSKKLFDNSQEATSVNWTTHEFDIWNNQKIKFQDLSVSYQKKIIDKINEIENENERKKFGKIAKVTIWTKEYRFNSNNKYEEVSTPTT